jgi:hypothetical protein
MKRLVITLLLSGVAIWSIWSAARIGIARTLSERAELTGEMAAADRAVRFSPRDAETHFARGALLQAAENYAEGSLEFEQAVALRPRDYYLWLLLGVTRDENGDQEGALRALRQSVALAPSYAPPRWQIGNLLLRMGRTDESFGELLTAAKSNPLLLPNVIDLAWGVYDSKPESVVSVIQPKTDNEHLALSIFFARHDHPAAALEQFRSVVKLTDPALPGLLEELLTRRAFNEAYQVWARMHGLSPTDGMAKIQNGGFEEPLTVGQRGFGWQVSADVTNVTMSLDPGEHQAGNRSLRVEFHGNSNPGLPLLSQTVLVKPQTRYRLTLAVESREFTSGALPLIRIQDASDKNEVVLAKSAPVSPDQSGWRILELDFSTTSQTQAITISLMRENCPQEPCPAFGILWLDSFALSPAS